MLAVVGLALIGIAAFASWRLSAPDNLPVLDVGKDFPARNPRDDESGLCPWRQPEADRKRFFPDATAEREDTLVLSRERAQTAKWLGRQPTGQENAIQIHRLVRRRGEQEEVVGTIVTRCVAGESGVIELVLAVDVDGRVRGARLQRLREPESVARELQSNRFLSAFNGKTWQSDWKAATQNSRISEAAKPSATSLLDGARTALILLRVGEQTLRR